MRLRGILGFVVLLPLLAGLGGARQKGRVAFDLGIWYFHAPFRLTSSERSSLTRIGVRTLYVRAATFAEGPLGPKLQLPQNWESPSLGLPVVLVFNFDFGLARRFDRVPQETNARRISERVTLEAKRAQEAGIEVAGIQFDADCPTRLVPAYAELLAEVKQRLKEKGAWRQGWTYSATALQTWFGAMSIRKLAESVDFLAPQFYEGRSSPMLGGIKPVGDLAMMRRTLARSGSLPCGIAAGLPAYGHALLFDETGKALSMYRGLSAGDALRHPSLQPAMTYPSSASGSPAARGNYAGEDILIVRAVEPARNGDGMGFFIAYEIPTLELLVRHLRALRSEAPENCTRIILYRFPEPDESLALPLRTVEAAFRGEAPTTMLEARLVRAESEALGDPSAGDPAPISEFTIEVENVGNSPTFAERGSAEVLVTWDGPGLVEARLSDFDDADHGRINSQGAFSPSSLARTNAVRCRRAIVMPGQKLRVGPITLDGSLPPSITVRWSVKGAGGFRVVTGSRALNLSTRPPFLTPNSNAKTP